MAEVITRGDHGAVTLHAVTAMPQASAFLWNSQMAIQVNCRGFAVAQYLDPEPTRYDHAPIMQATSFMQPEQAFFDHHPGRFFYCKHRHTGRLFSLTHHPLGSRETPHAFEARADAIVYRVTDDGLNASATLRLVAGHTLEQWTVMIENTSATSRDVDVYPYFPIGYMSWMNQSASYCDDYHGIVCRSVRPYQQLEDYPGVKRARSTTALVADRRPHAYDARQDAFEGFGGLRRPDGVLASTLSGSEARYETPAAVLQFPLTLDPGESQTIRLAFGPVRSEDDVRGLRDAAFATPPTRCTEAVSSFAIRTPARRLDHFINHWLGRQVRYHGELNRLTTDPQTRNYLQDHLGMVYVDPTTTRTALLTAMSQQQRTGAMPDGVLLHPDAQHKYINLVPHSDHCVWLPVVVSAYLDETGDREFLSTPVSWADGKESDPVKIHVNRAMDWLLAHRDSRGLCLIGQGDWCDPMNMVGPRGRGVSGWLTLATAWALEQWVQTMDHYDRNESSARFRDGAAACGDAMNRHLWDGSWYGRGITDDGNAFGVHADPEGRIYLNPQSFALLSGVADDRKVARILGAIREHLLTEDGPTMLHPPYTRMREDIGRLTQKHPGSAENGSVYNHAVAFLIYALYQRRESEFAYSLIQTMLPGSGTSELIRRGQLPVFLPNYYRGAHQLHARTAGRSSQLFHTGTVHWLYRSIIEQLFGLRGERDGLRVDPQLPASWNRAEATRHFRGAVYRVHYQREDCDRAIIRLDGRAIKGSLICGHSGSSAQHEVVVALPKELPE